MKKTFDVGIVGLGITGSALASQLAKDGLNVIAIDKNSENTSNSSSYGENRIFRVLHDEFSLSSICHKTFKKFNTPLDSSINFFIKCGHVTVIPKQNLTLYMNQASNLKLDIVVLDKDRLFKFNRLIISENELAIFEPLSGYIVPNKFMTYLNNQAISNGATIIKNRNVFVNFELNNIHLHENVYKCDFLLIATGSDLQDTLNQLGYHNEATIFYKIYQKTIFVNQNCNLYQNTWFNSSNLNYGFPFLVGQGNRIGVGELASKDKNALKDIDYNKKDTKKKIIKAINNDQITINNLKISKQYSGVYVKSILKEHFHFKQLNRTTGYVFSCGGHGFKMSLYMADMVSKMIQKVLY